MIKHNGKKDNLTVIKYFRESFMQLENRQY